MKILQLKQAGNVYSIFDQAVKIYTIEHTQSGSTKTLCLKNAFDEEILTLRIQKSGFTLFRSNKTTTMSIQTKQHAGSVVARDYSYEWMIHGISYTFVCGELQGSDALIMSDHEDTLAYAYKEEITMLQSMYSAEICIFFAYVCSCKDKVQLDVEKFKRAWAEVKEENKS